MRKGLALSNGPRTPVRTRGAIGATLLSLICLGAAGIVSLESGLVLSARATAAGIPRCSNLDVKEIVTTSQRNYGPGIMVVMTSSIHNMSSEFCSVAIGPTSPSLSVTNSKGVMEWNNCYANNRPGACAPYLTTHTLNPGATYAKTFAWNQRSRLQRTRVPTGTYQLVARFSGIAGTHAIRFQLTRSAPPRSITITQADSGRRVSLHEGARLIIQLVGPANYTWSEPLSTNATVLERSEGSSGYIASATFVAKSSGQVRVTAVDNPNCYPQCLAPSRLFELTVSVVS